MILNWAAIVSLSSKRSIYFLQITVLGYERFPVSKEENREGLGLMIVAMCTIEKDGYIFQLRDKGNNRSACAARIACLCGI